MRQFSLEWLPGSRTIRDLMITSGRGHFKDSIAFFDVGGTSRSVHFPPGVAPQNLDFDVKEFLRSSPNPGTNRECDSVDNTPSQCYTSCRPCVQSLIKCSIRSYQRHMTLAQVDEKIIASFHRESRFVINMVAERVRHVVGSQTSMFHRLSSERSKCPRWRSRFLMFLCRRWSSRNCRRPCPMTESSSGLRSTSLSFVFRRM